MVRRKKEKRKIWTKLKDYISHKGKDGRKGFNGNKKEGWKDRGREKGREWKWRKRKEKKRRIKRQHTQVYLCFLISLSPLWSSNNDVRYTITKFRGWTSISLTHSTRKHNSSDPPGLLLLKQDYQGLFTWRKVVLSRKVTLPLKLTLPSIYMYMGK